MKAAKAHGATPAARVVYFTGGPANLIAAHRSWRTKVHEPTEVSVTFSSQIEEVCESLNIPALMISIRSPAESMEDGLFRIEHRAKPDLVGWRYHLGELRYFFGLLRAAREFKATHALVDSGAAQFFWFALFKLAGIRVVPVLHNTLWPTGFYPQRSVHRALLWLDKMLFWKKVPVALISVSPECERQVLRLVPDAKYERLQARAQFRLDYFQSIPAADYPEQGRFNVLFIGRVEEEKGVFDIVEMAACAESRSPGRVYWRICGTGSALEEVRRRVAARGLQHTVELVGWVSLEQLADIYAQTHCCIVPTRSSFTEALAMTAVEAVLAHRPLVSNPVVPATEILRPACLLGKTNDYQSHVDAVLMLAHDRALYERLQAACDSLAEEFTNPSHSLGAKVRQALNLPASSSF